MTKDLIGYNDIINRSKFFIIEDALSFVKKNDGFPGDHHFYITFETNFNGVEVSENLHKEFPNEMTIVLQHQFSELDVKTNYFTVTLHFANIPEKIVVPYKAIKRFYDPAVDFVIDLNIQNEEMPLSSEKHNLEELKTNEELNKPRNVDKNISNNGQVISLNRFKKDLKK